ncbi:NACHT domain-containing protein [Lentzea albidocapillata]|uniref:NACHT domain-containing protein n=2 Tax=Lentzea albidocapillata TaxID=40571 RepID=A0A1W2E900_9PSEU|nr:NACHT domain-containing protein [Lentzea albidocapillata]
MMRRMSRFRQQALLTGCVLTAVLTAAGLFVTDHGINPHLWLIVLALAFLGFLALLDPWVRRRHNAALSTDEHLDAACRALAVGLQSQWNEEVRSRGLTDPDLLDLHWIAPELDVSDEPDAPPGRSDAVVGALERQINRRMVIIGEAGTGKSTVAMLLTCGLLDRYDGGMVPVLLPLSTWNPAVEDIRTWLTRRLYEDHPALRNTELYGSYAGDLLIEQHLVLPVLDGLDDIPAHQRADALERIAKAFPAKRPLVLTCRTDEFAQAVDLAGPLPGADVVELAPLDLDEVAAYLRASADSWGAARWEPVFIQLREEPDGRLADALSTPLTMWLASMVYADSEAEPTELLDRGRFPDARAISDHLCDELVSRAFGNRAFAHHAKATQVWPRDRARKWLEFLAHEMRDRGIRELAWWELRRSVGSTWLAVLGALVLGAIGGFGVGWLMAYSITPSLAPITGLVAGIGVGAAALTASHERKAKPRLGIWRSLLLVPGVLGLAAGLVFGALYGLSAGLVVGLGLAVAIALRFALSSAAELSQASSPQWTMARDRIAVWTGSLVLAVVFGSAAALVFGPAQTGMVGLGLASGLMLGFALAVLHLRWWWFTVARIWLALRGKLPWELMVFLEDARKLGVLCRAGACYQFRHGLVQDRLAEHEMTTRSAGRVLWSPSQRKATSEH